MRDRWLNPASPKRDTGYGNFRNRSALNMQNPPLRIEQRAERREVGMAEHRDQPEAAIWERIIGEADILRHPVRRQLGAQGCDGFAHRILIRATPAGPPVHIGVRHGVNEGGGEIIRGVAADLQIALTGAVHARAGGELLDAEIQRGPHPKRAIVTRGRQIRRENTGIITLEGGMAQIIRSCVKNG